MNLFLAFYIVGAVLNCVIMFMLREAFVENGKSSRVYYISTVGVTLLSCVVWLVGIGIVICDIAIRMAEGATVDYDSDTQRGGHQGSPWPRQPR